MRAGDAAVSRKPRAVDVRSRVPDRTRRPCSRSPAGPVGVRPPLIRRVRPPPPAAVPSVGRRRGGLRGVLQVDDVGRISSPTDQLTVARRTRLIVRATHAAVLQNTHVHDVLEHCKRARQFIGGLARRRQISVYA